MSLLPAIANPYLSAFVGGLAFGLAYCTASCLPVVAGYIAGVGSGFKQSVKITAIFNGGRILAYTIIGAVVGVFGELLRFFVSESAITPFQIYSSLAFGVVTIAIGAMLMWKIRKPSGCECKPSDAAVTAGRIKRYGVDFGAFTLGFTRGLIICTPLILLLSTSLTLVDAAGSIAVALLFGVGTSISPILILGGVTGWLLNKAPLFRKWISIAGGLILIFLGALSVYSSLTQIG
ncbi:sulfite exporter TauE/SafE family protein [Candidatus Bathyarchaeota archaeon]|nr:sulfite exporter TauE/SafE family protein [Candidatus Bathyarchaeota archaeon]